MSQLEFRKQLVQNEFDALMMNWITTMKVFDFHIEVTYEKSETDNTPVTAYIIKRINTENYNEEELANRISYDYVQAVKGGNILDILLRVEKCVYKPPDEEGEEYEIKA